MTVSFNWQQELIGVACEYYWVLWYRMPAKRNVTDGKTAEGMLRCGATPTYANETDFQC